MQTRWVNATFWGPDPRLHPGIVYSQYARDVDVEPGAASKIRNPKISKSWRKFPRKSLRCPWVPGTLHPIAMLQLHPNHCKAQAVQPSENIPSIRYVRTCATTTTWRQRTATSKSLFSWGHRLGGMWSRRLRRRRLLFLPSPWSNEIPWETQFSEEETNPSFEIFFSHKHNWFQWNVGLFKFSDPNQRLIWCQWTVAFTRLHESEQVESFDLLFAMLWPEWSDFPSSLMRPCDPWCSVPPRVHTNQTIAPEGHPPAAHLQSTSTLYICTYKNHQRTARPINNNHSIDVHIHVCTHTYFSICYAKRWNEFQCDAKPPKNPTRNPCVSPWRQFQCLHAGNQNLCRCQR